MDDGGCCGGARQGEAYSDAGYCYFAAHGPSPRPDTGGQSMRARERWHDLAHWQFLDASFQYPSEPSFEILAGVGHGLTSCRNWVSAREARDFTVPGRHPRIWAISASDQPPQ